MIPKPLPAHPRLFASAADWDLLKKRISTDDFSSRIFRILLARSEKLLAEPPVKREMQGRRLLAVSRLCLERVTALSCTSRLTGDDRFARRAVEEMKAAAAFSDWNPSHFLDVGEMSLALAIGYDWLHDRMSPEDRSTIAKALLEKGVGPTWEGKQANWVTSTNNWNQVCHTGITLAALAIAEDHPELAEKTLERAVSNIGKCMHSYAPDGAYAEGPMYWGYGTMFHVTLLSAVQHLTGNMFGMDMYPGFAESGDYILQMSMPSDTFFCYSDARPNRGFEVPLFWFAGKYGRPDLVAYELRNLDAKLSGYNGRKQNDGLRLLPLILFWYNPEDPVRTSLKPPATLDWLGRGPTPVAMHRSAFNDKLALCAGIKGGSPSYSHAHMDEGSFVLEADGVQWVTDLGMEEYNRLETMKIGLWDGKQNGQRWEVFRLGPDSHNILRFNGKLQNVKEKSEIVRHSAEGRTPHTVVELTPSYKGQIKYARRGLAMIDRKAYLLQDEWHTLPDSGAVAVDWQLLTTADKVEPSADGKKVMLRKADKLLTLYILSPERPEIRVDDVSKGKRDFDAENPGAKQLILRLTTPPDAAGGLRVLMVPGSSVGLDHASAPDMGAVLAWSKPLSDK